MYLLLSECSRQEASHLDNSRNVRLARDVGTRWPARAWTSHVHVRTLAARTGCDQSTSVTHTSF